MFRTVTLFTSSQPMISSETIINKIEQLRHNTNELKNFLSSLKKPLNETIVLHHYKGNPSSNLLHIALIQGSGILGALIQLTDQSSLDAALLENLEGFGNGLHLLITNYFKHTITEVNLLLNTVSRNALNKAIVIQKLPEHLTPLDLVMMYKPDLNNMYDSTLQQQITCTLIFKVDKEALNEAALLDRCFGKNIFHQLIQNKTSTKIIKLLLHKLNPETIHLLLTTKASIQHEDFLPLDLAVKKSDFTHRIKNHNGAKNMTTAFLFSTLEYNTIISALEKSSHTFAAIRILLSLENPLCVNILIEKTMQTNNFNRTFNNFTQTELLTFMSWAPITHKNLRYIAWEKPDLIKASTNKNLKYSNSSVENYQKNFRKERLIKLKLKRAISDNELEKKMLFIALTQFITLIKVDDLINIILQYIGITPFIYNHVIEKIKLQNASAFAEPNDKEHESAGTKRFRK